MPAFTFPGPVELAAAGYPDGINYDSINREITVPSSTAVFQVNVPVGIGTYTISCTSSVNASLAFQNSTGVVATVTTASGTGTVDITSPATKITASINTGTNIPVTIALSKIKFPSATTASFTLYTITSTQNMPASGVAWVTAIGGGAGGAGGSTNGWNTNTPTNQLWGGSSGGVVSAGPISVTTNTLVTIGAQGNGATGTGNNFPNGNSGGATTVGNLVTAGGGTAGAGPTGAGGGGQGWNAGDPRQGINGSASTTSAFSWIGQGSSTTGGGNGGGFNFSVGGAVNNFRAGSGWGQGGTGGADSNNGGSGSGYGAGGGAGGARNANTTGGNGTAGVVFVAIAN